jgi:preprotein translocase subunit SecG
MLLSILLTIHIIVCIALILVILMQRSEGGALGMGGGGGGGGGGIMTARGTGDLLSRTTWTLAVIFFVLSVLLTILAGRGRANDSVVDRLKIDAMDVETLKPKAAPSNGAPEAPTPQVRPVSQPPEAAVPAPAAVKPATAPVPAPVPAKTAP